jgi:PEP-CTERM motif
MPALSDEGSPFGLADRCRLLPSDFPGEESMVAHARRRILVLVLLGFGCHASAAQADPISITGGLVDVKTAGFQIRGIDTVLAGTPITVDAAWVFAEGAVVNLSRAVTVGISFATPVTQIVNGTTFEAVLGGTLNFSATPFTAPPPPLDEPFAPFTLSTPFEMSGQLSGFMQTPGQGTPLFSIALAGGGVATVTGRVNTPSGFYVGDTLQFRFTDTAPIPEPASMFLVATGIAGLCGMRSRSRRERTK